MGRDKILVRGDLSKFWLVGGGIPPSPPPPPLGETLLCLEHLIPCYQKLLELDRVLLLLWKMFKYSSIKEAIFEQTRSFKPKTPKSFKVMHGESCVRIISRFQSLIDALDVIFFKRADQTLRKKESEISFLNQICCCYYFWPKSESYQYIIKVSSKKHSGVHLNYHKG